MKNTFSVLAALFLLIQAGHTADIVTAECHNIGDIEFLEVFYDGNTKNDFEVDSRLRFGREETETIEGGYNLITQDIIENSPMYQQILRNLRINANSVRVMHDFTLAESRYDGGNRLIAIEGHFNERIATAMHVMGTTIHCR